MSAKEKEFWELSETWYKRTRRLREVTEKENETPERKRKALKLFLIMVGRMMKVNSMAVKRSTPRAPMNYERGGK